MRPFTTALTVVQNRLGAVPRPAWCTYLTTFRCNARCGMCDSWRLPPGAELTPAQVAAVFDKIGRLDVVRLSGGEPFLRKDLSEIAEAILRASRPFVIHVTTNGSLPERVETFVRSFSQPRTLRFMVSFDGLPETHDRSRGDHASFATALETVRRLAALRDACGVEVSANHTVISSQSLQDNAGLRRALARFGVEVHSVLAYADSAMYTAELQGATANHLIVPRGYPLHPALEGADALGFVETELRNAARLRDRLLRWGKRYYLRGLRSRLRADERPSPNPPCVALRSHVRLLPDGGVPVCQFNTRQVGNLLRQNFDEVWHGPRGRAARRWVTHCPGCWAECEVMPNTIYSGDLLRPV